MESPASLGVHRLKRVPVSFCLCIVSLVFHLFAIVAKTEVVKNNQVVKALAVSPSDTLMHGKIWTVLTCGLVEENSFKFLVFFTLVAVVAFSVEEEMTSQQLAKLLLVSQGLASLGSTLLFLGFYFFTLNDDIFFSPVFGLGGLLVTLLLGFLKLHQHSYQSLLVLTILAYSLLGLQFPLFDALLVVLSFVIGVVYLRDETFSFASFFPGKALKKADRSANSSSSLLLQQAALDPTKERFRAKGFKLLDKKLAELEAAPEVPLDGGNNIS